MRKILTPSTIVILFFITLTNTMVVKDYDDVALARIDDLSVSPGRRIRNVVSSGFKDLETKRKLESKLRDLLELDGSAGPKRKPMIRHNREEDADDEEISSSDPTDPDDEADQEESVEYVQEDDDDDNQDTTTNPIEKTSKHVGLIHRIGKKLLDRKTKFTISLPVAIIAVGSIILLTCCCSIYLRNRLVACIDRLPGRGKKRKSRMLAVDSERGRSTPRSKKRREKSISLSRRRARSLSRDMVEMGTQKSAPITRDVEEKSSTTGCYRCCKKKKKRGQKNDR